MSRTTSPGTCAALAGTFGSALAAGLWLLHGHLRSPLRAGDDDTAARLATPGENIHAREPEVPSGGEGDGAEEAPALPHARPAAHAISGRVVDPELKEPIGEAALALHVKADAAKDLPVWKGTSDLDGAFELEGLAPGEYRLSAGAPGYLRNSIEIVIGPEPHDTGLEVPLLAGCSIAGRVLDARGDPVAGASVSSDWFKRPGWEGTGGGCGSNLLARTDASGEFRFEPLPPQLSYNVFVTHVGHAWGLARDIRVRAREDREGIEIVLADGGDVRGRVTGAQGYGIEGAEVTVRPNEGELSSGRRGRRRRPAA